VDLLTRHRSSLHITEPINSSGDSQSRSICSLGGDSFDRGSLTLHCQFSACMKRNPDAALDIFATFRSIHISQRNVDGVNMRTKSIESKLEAAINVFSLVLRDSHVTIKNLNSHGLTFPVIKSSVIVIDRINIRPNLAVSEELTNSN
jgi:hypothetical protein